MEDTTMTLTARKTEMDYFQRFMKVIDAPFRDSRYHNFCYDNSSYYHQYKLQRMIAGGERLSKHLSKVLSSQELELNLPYSSYDEYGYPTLLVTAVQKSNYAAQKKILSIFAILVMPCSRFSKPSRCCSQHLFIASACLT